MASYENKIVQQGVYINNHLSRRTALVESTSQNYSLNCGLKWLWKNGIWIKRRMHVYPKLVFQ